MPHGELETQTLLLKGHVRPLQMLLVVDTEYILPFKIAKRWCEFLVWDFLGGFFGFYFLVSESNEIAAVPRHPFSCFPCSK